MGCVVSRLFWLHNCPPSQWNCNPYSMVGRSATREYDHHATTYNQATHQKRCSGPEPDPGEASASSPTRQSTAQILVVDPTSPFGRSRKGEDGTPTPVMGG